MEDVTAKGRLEKCRSGGRRLRAQGQPADVSEGTLTGHRTGFQRVWDQIGARKVLFPCLLSPTWIPEHIS